jgi:hypothetical protein
VQVRYARGVEECPATAGRFKMEALKTRTKNYYEALLMQERTLGLTLDEARGDIERLYQTVVRVDLNLN